MPDWLGGIGSVGALFLLLIGLGREVRRQRQDRLNAAIAQARLISAKVYRDGNQVTRVAVENASAGLISDVEIRLILADSIDDQETPPRLSISDDGRDDRLNPRDTTVFVVRHMETVVIDKVELIFTDQNGLRWVRRGSWQPEPVLPAIPLQRRLWRSRPGNEASKSA